LGSAALLWSFAYGQLGSWFPVLWSSSLDVCISLISSSGCQILPRLYHPKMLDSILCTLLITTNMFTKQICTSSRKRNDLLHIFLYLKAQKIKHNPCLLRRDRDYRGRKCCLENSSCYFRTLFVNKINFFGNFIYVFQKNMHILRQ
jgi:hypothetical protein